ncbi:MAG: PepSY-associated TM helix domain-containing protein [Gammaproteobacteria bacterium]
MIGAVHRVGGVLLGAVFVVVGLTGSVLVYYLEIDRLLNPALASHAAQRAVPSYEALYRALRAAEPARTGPWRLEFPSDPARLVAARYYAPAERITRGFAPLMVELDPVTARVVEARLWGDYAMTWIYDLHYTLLFDWPGRRLLGGIGLLLLVTMMAGTVLWWRTGRGWRDRLRLRPRRGRARRVFDFHRASAVYGFALTLLLIVTGVALAWPETTRGVLGGVGPLWAPPPLRSTPSSSPRLPLDAAVATARARFPDARLAWIETPDGAHGVYRVNLQQPGEPSQRFPRTNVWLDQYSGRVLHVRDPRQDGAGDIVLNWLHPLHNGEAAGGAGRALVCVAGLLPTALWVTGVLRWRQKRHARRTLRRRARHPAAGPES